MATASAVQAAPSRGNKLADTAAEDAAKLLKAARAIEDLAGSDVAQATFFRRLLAHVIDALEAQAAVVWLLNADGLLSGECESGLDSLSDRAWIGGAPHLRFLDQALGSSQPVVSEPGPDLAPGLVLIASRFEIDGRPAGVVECLFDLSAPPSGDEPQSFIEDAATQAGRYLAWRQAADSTAKQIEFWASLNELTADLHRSLRIAEVAATAVNDARALLDVDRVSLAVAWGAGCRVLAISGQDHVHRRANLVRTLTGLAREVLVSGQELTYTGRLDDFPPQLERPLAEYLAHSGSRMIRMIPLFPPQVVLADSSESAVSQSPPLGVLILERVSQSWLTPLDVERGQRLAEHVAGAVANARAHEGLFLLPVWRLLGSGWGWFRGRRLALATAILAAVAGIVGALFLVPADYRVEAKGRLMPQARRAVFAPWDGEVVELLVQSEQRVARDQPLLHLRNDDLQAQLLAARSQLEEKRKALTALQAELDEISRRASAQHQYEATRLRGRLAQTRTEITGAEQQVQSLEQQMDLLTVRAPIDGTVAVFQLEQLLLNRPVQRGELLLEVMDEAGAWELDLDVPEFRMGHVLDARDAAPAEKLPVEFVLATRPEQRFNGALRDVSTRTGLSEDGGTVVAAHVAIDAAELPERTIGAEVQAKISCGPRSLGYVLFGDVVEFFRRRFW